MDSGNLCFRKLTTLLLAVLVLAAVYRPAYAAAPVAVDDVRTIPVDSALTINVLSNDFDSDNDPILLISLSQPQNGSVAQSGSNGTVVYTPNADFIGSDSFTYVIQEQNTDGLTATGTVTVNVTENAFGPGLALTSNMRSLAQALAIACANARNQSDAELGETGRLLLQRCDELEQIAQNDPAAIQSVLEQIAPDETLSQVRVAVNESNVQTQAVAKRIEQRRLSGTSSISINGVALSDHPNQARGGSASADDGGVYSPLGLFASIQLEESEYEKNDFENGFDSANNSLTAGLDYYINAQWLAGAAVGYSSQDISYNNNDGQLDVSAVTFIAFTSYQYASFTFDLQAGYTGGQLDINRRIHYAAAGVALDQEVTSATDSSQWLLHGQAQWEWHRDALSVFPFVTLDFKTTEVSGFGEEGSTGWEMDIRSQSEQQTTFGAGVQSTYALKMNWGVLLPAFSLTALSDSLSQRNTFVGRLAYDATPDNNYIMQGQETEAMYYQIRLGTSAIFKRGASAFVEYSQVLDYEFYDSYQLQFGFRKAF